MKVLIVEDSMFVRKILQKIFTEHIDNCEVLTAADGQQGYELYKEHGPDLITTDLLMPNLNGQEMLKKIRETDASTPVIVISADVQKTTKNEVESLGIVDFVNKPITKDKTSLIVDLVKEVQNVK